MQSKTSCFNKTLFRKHVTRFWPVWGAYLVIWLLAMPVSMLSQRGFLLRSAAHLQQSVLNSINTGIVLSFGFSVLMAMAVWSFLYSSRSASGAACLPVTRTAQFWSAALAGLLPLAAANVLTFVLTALAEASLGILHLPSLLCWLGATLLILLFFYGFATFCAMLTGNIIVLPAVYAVLNFVAAGAQVLLDGLVKCFLYGVSGLGGSWLYSLSPVVELFSRVTPDPIMAYDEATQTAVTVAWRFTGWGAVGIYAAVGVALLFAALALLKRRKMETAGDVVAVAALKPVFRWCMGVFGALCFADMMLYVFQLAGGDTQAAVFAVTALYLVVGAFLGWFIAEMLIRRSFRVFRGGWRGFGGWAVCCAVLLAALTATELDVLGIEKRVPAADKVENVVVMAGGETACLSTPESIAQTQALHRAILAHKAQQDQCDQRAFFLHGAPADMQTVNVHIRYYLKNGAELTRNYVLPYRSPEDDALAAQALLNCAEAVQSRRETPFDLTQENVSYGSISAVMTAAECAAAAGYDDPAEYVLCELAGCSRAQAAAMEPEARDQLLRDTLANLRYLDDEEALRAAEYEEKYDLSYLTAYLPEKNGAPDWDRIWLEYTLELTKQEAWELYASCVRPDLTDSALGRVWILRDSDYAASVCAASVEIEARYPDADRTGVPTVADYGASSYDVPATMYQTQTHYYYFRAVPTADSARTNAFFAERGLHLSTVAELRAAMR